MSGEAVAKPFANDRSARDSRAQCCTGRARESRALRGFATASGDGSDGKVDRAHQRHHGRTPVLSVIIPSLDGRIPHSLQEQVEGCPDVELVVVAGVRPVGRARNEGLKRATGEYVAWVDSDDEVSEDWAAEILKTLQAAPDVVTLDAELVGWGKERCDFIWGVSADDASIDRLRRDVYYDVCRPSSLWLYVTRRNLWEGLSFDESVRMAEDYLILPHVLLRAMSCTYLPQKLYRYRRNAASLINTQTSALDEPVIDLWLRRFEECPPVYRGSCRWGFCASAYWIGCRLAIGEPGVDDQFRANAKRCRKLIRHSLLPLLGEAASSASLPWRDRILWPIRFLTAALNIWTIQKLRHGRNRA